MPQFSFEALNAEGLPLHGTLAASDEREAVRTLDRRGLVVLALHAASPGTRTRIGR